MRDKHQIHVLAPEVDGYRALLGACAIVVLLTFLIFFPAVRNGFVYTWDDEGYIASNAHISELSPEMVGWAFSNFYTGNWHPLTLISLALDYKLWGLDPTGYHLTNIILHAINAGFFFLLAAALLRSRQHALQSKVGTPGSRTANDVIACSMLAALLFAVHPLRVESVAWVSERKDALSVFFGLPAIFFYLKHARYTRNRARLYHHPASFFASPYYWISFAFFCLSLLAKPTLVTLPLVLLVLDWYPLRRLERIAFLERVVEKTPFLLLSGIIALLTIVAQTKALIPIEDAALLSRIQIASKNIMTYLWMTVWPVGLSPFYLYPGNLTGLHPEYLFPMLLTLAVTVCCLLLRHRYPVLTAAWMIYLITLLPVVGLVPIGVTEMADRYTYVPGMAVSLVIALGITAATARYSRSRTAVTIIVIAVLIMLTTASALTVRQIAFWKDDVTLWSRAIDVRPHFSGRAYFQRGLSYSAIGEDRKALEDFNEALAIATRKKNHDAICANYIERARILRRLGDFKGALENYSLAISTESSLPKSLFYSERGYLYREMGKAKLANEDFRMAESGNNK